ncbi:hypothetical protein [Terribacillus saccharophilus]|uniref:hypothetical protein n=1 Tax=Terribacillus saccharophilus TaxID=361277 RepID=UPI001140C365|nr:hypothetical protein [Terribacillus saccharophilus]
MNAKEVRKGIEDANARLTVGGLMIFQVVYASFLTMLVTWNWIGAVLALIILTAVLVPRKTRRIGLILLTLSASVLTAYLAFLATGIIGAIIAFIVILLISGFINLGFYGASLEDWEDEDKERQLNK